MGYFEMFLCGVIVFFSGMVIGTLRNHKQWAEGYDEGCKQTTENLTAYGVIVAKNIDLDEIMVEDEYGDWDRYKRVVY